jgi:hypothetical protein
MTVASTGSSFSLVIPAKAGIQTDSVPGANAARIPAFAGMTEEEVG